MTEQILYGDKFVSEMAWWKTKAHVKRNRIGGYKAEFMSLFIQSVPILNQISKLHNPLKKRLEESRSSQYHIMKAFYLLAFLIPALTLAAPQDTSAKNPLSFIKRQTDCDGFPCTPNGPFGECPGTVVS